MILCTNEIFSELWDHTLDTFKPDRDDARFLAMPRPYQVFYLVFWWDCECQNGGLGQFILNPSGNLYQETIQALVEIGALRSARWLSLTQESFGVTFSKDLTQRHHQLGDCEIADLDRLAGAAGEQTVAEMGNWETEENEMNLLCFVKLHDLVEIDIDA